MIRFGWKQVATVLVIVALLTLAALACYDTVYQGDCWGREGSWVDGRCVWRH